MPNQMKTKDMRFQPANRVWADLCMGTCVHGGAFLEPSLMVIGVNFRATPASVRERFRIAENCRTRTLDQLSRAEGIEEVLLLATNDRTEFIVWASDVTLAANSVMRHLTREYGLMQGDWQHFYRLLDEAALLHIFRVAIHSGSKPEKQSAIGSELKSAYKQSQDASAPGVHLTAVVAKALALAERVRREISGGSSKLRGIRHKEWLGGDADVADAERILHAETQDFFRSLTAQAVAPAMVALRHRLDEICRQELESFGQENGPFTQDQNDMLTAILSRITQRITGSLAREIKELPEKAEQEQLTLAVERLFHLKTPEVALAGTSS